MLPIRPAAFVAVVCIPLSALFAHVPATDPAAAFDKREEMIPMRDGTKLHTLIYTPKNQTGNLPIIFTRTPYGIAGAGGLFRLPRRVGPGASALLGLTGTPVSGEEGHRIGLVDVLVGPGEALHRSQALASTIAANGPLAVDTTKALLSGSFDVAEREFWDWQGPYFEKVATSDDAREGAEAFVAR